MGPRSPKGAESEGQVEVMETPVGRDGGGGLQGEEAKEGRRAYET